jgi:hypothetical protein
MTSKPASIVSLFSALFLALAANAAQTSQAAPATNTVAQIGQQQLEFLQKPELAVSRCTISPVFESDGVTVAVSTDRMFSAGDVVLAVGDETLDPSSKTPLRDIFMKHRPDEAVSIRLRRAGKDLTVAAKCMDAKPLNDLWLEAAYAASKNDAATCYDKMQAAARLHALNTGAMWLSFQCGVRAGRITGSSAQGQGYYEVHREMILEAQWSADALGRVRGTVLGAVDNLQKNNESMLGLDLKQQYDQALANASVVSAAPSVAQ